MATKPETSDLIEFRFRCAVADAGHFIALLTKAGVQQISHELITEVATFRQRTGHSIKAEDFLTTWIKDHPTFRAKEAIQAFTADGRTNGSGYTALRMLVESGTLKKLGEGNYARTDVKHIAGPKDKNPKGETTQNKYAVPNPAFIMRLAKRKKNGVITSAQIKGFFEKDGRAKTSVGPALTTLLEQKAITRIGEGQYQITDMIPSKRNGNGSHLEGAANHG